MIFDCFIFNNELDLLELRLDFLYDHVDFFVLVESGRTLSGIKKPLTFQENKDRFSKYLNKIIYLECPEKPELVNWEYEYFQRNYIMEGLKNAADDDLVFISDVDEIVNIPQILNYKNLRLPALIELPMYYYFFNLKAEITYKLNIVSTYGFLKNHHIGERNKSYHTFIPNYVNIGDVPKTGWHFSYLFGFDYQKYQDKISAFSHQEHNTEEKKNPKNIYRNIILGRDLFGRSYLSYEFKGKEEIREIYPNIQKLNLEKYYFRLTPKIFFERLKLNISGKIGMINYYLTRILKPKKK